MSRILAITRLYVWQHYDPSIIHLLNAVYSHWSILPPFELLDQNAEAINAVSAIAWERHEDNPLLTIDMTVVAEDSGSATKLKISLPSGIVVSVGWERVISRYYSISISFGSVPYPSTSRHAASLIRALEHRVRAFDVSVRTDEGFAGMRADHPAVVAFCANLSSAA